jgi:hypothetical protein
MAEDAIRRLDKMIQSSLITPLLSRAFELEHQVGTTIHFVLYRSYSRLP